MNNLKILSLNCGGYKAAQAKIFQKYLSRIRPQILALQECNPKQYLAHLKLKNYQIFQPPGRLNHGKANILAFDSQIRVIKTDYLELVRLQRKQITCRCSYRGINFQVTCLHLKAGSDPLFKEVRQKQLAELIRKIHESSRINHLIVGDFNMRKEEDFSGRGWSWAELKDTYCSTNQMVKDRYPNNKGVYGHPFDRLYYRSRQLTDPKVEVLTKCQASDHYPVIFEIRLSSGTSGCTIL